MFFYVVIKNLNWEVLTNNVVTFKRRDGVKDEKFEYYGGSLKNLIFRVGGVHEKPIHRGELPKMGGGAWTVCRLNGAWQKRGGWCFWEGVDTPVYTINDWQFEFKIKTMVRNRQNQFRGLPTSTFNLKVWFIPNNHWTYSHFGKLKVIYRFIIYVST